MSCTLAESCKVIIESKDKEIERLTEEKEALESEIESYETKDKVAKVLLILQGALLMVAFQIWD